MKTKLFIGVILVAFAGSCITPRYLPESRKLDENEFGSYIKVICKTGPDIKGELISIDHNKLIVLTNSYSTVTISLDEISRFKIRYAQPKSYEWSIALFTLATFSHGFLLILTAPINLIVTTVVTVSSENAFRYNSRNMSYSELRMFARFPQGVPPNVDLTTIK